MYDKIKGKFNSKPSLRNIQVPTDIILEDNELDPDTKQMNNEFDMKIEEEKIEEDEFKNKEKKAYGEKDVNDFYDRLKLRLDSKVETALANSELNKEMNKESNHADTHNNPFYAQMVRNRTSLANVFERRNSLTVQLEMFSRQNSIIQRLAKKNSDSRLLPDSVRTKTFVQQIENQRKINEGTLVVKKTKYNCQAHYYNNNYTIKNLFN